MPSKKKRKRVERPSIHPRNTTRPTSPSWRLSTRRSSPSSSTPETAGPESIGPTSMPPKSSLGWIPDGQLCPSVPNRSNYIHWIEDLLVSDIIPSTRTNGDIIKGFDIGTGANCIYPLLGASLLGWSFVGSDVTDVAPEWAERNVVNNPHISGLIEIRKVDGGEKMVYREESQTDQSVSKHCINLSEVGVVDREASASALFESYLGANKSYHGPFILLGAVKDGEKFDFCMCNPPFFETIEEAG
ncbi:hypothetical protein RJ639_040039 [Escallonia herrerae]|uniref:U6 small nuclear RNA (adenine-(43)-N(6))-methyltransferase n=1 Tax=Escallonia herrerae TaxID=1293975 RepID=A0AA89B5E8_9ASTE|nr:hypothetical protein RJ639_040039 [Escallonia herrerae]